MYIIAIILLFRRKKCVLDNVDKKPNLKIVTSEYTFNPVDLLWIEFIKHYIYLKMTFILRRTSPYALAFLPFYNTSNAHDIPKDSTYVEEPKTTTRMERFQNIFYQEWVFLHLHSFLETKTCFTLNLP